MTISLKGKTFVIMGVANKRSIAWGIARSLDQSGANLIFTYAGERFEKSVRDLVATLDGKHELILPCDVTSDEDVEKCFGAIKEQAGKISEVACDSWAEGYYPRDSHDENEQMLEKNQRQGQPCRR